MLVATNLQGIVLGGFMNTLCVDTLDRNLAVDNSYTLANISKAFYSALICHSGSAESVLMSAHLSPAELSSIKNGSASYELIRRTCENLYLQFKIKRHSSGIVCTVNGPSCIYWLTK